MASISLAGCGGTVFVEIGTTPTPDNTITGNWQINATTTSGAQPFSALSGSMLQQAAQGNGGLPVVGVFQVVNPGACFAGLTAVPAQGFLSGTDLSLTSFSTNGQYLSLTGNTAAGGAQLSGTFQVNSGCANGVKGNLSGTKIAPLSGSYSGVENEASVPLTIALTQDDAADGLGYFHLQGTASFGGISCFTNGTVSSSQSTVSGQQVQLVIDTSEATPSTVIASGTLAPSANTLTLNSLQITSGGCSGPAGTATLSRP